MKPAEKSAEKESKPDARLLKVFHLLDAHGIHKEFYIQDSELLKGCRNVSKEDEASIERFSKPIDPTKPLTDRDKQTINALIYKYNVDHYSHLLVLKETFFAVEPLLSNASKTYMLDDMRKLLSQHPANVLEVNIDDYDNLVYEVLQTRIQKIDAKFKTIIISYFTGVD